MGKYLKEIFKRLYHNFLAWFILLGAWIIYIGHLTLVNLILGLIISAAPIIIFPELFTKIITPKAYKRLPFLLVFLLYLLIEVFLACYRMAYFTVNTKINLKSSIYIYEYGLTNSTAIFFLATVITLTPGTLVLDIARTEDKLYIHALDQFSKDKGAVMANIELMEKWLRRIFE